MSARYPDRKSPPGVGWNRNPSMADAKCDWMRLLIVEAQPPRKTNGLICWSKDRGKPSYVVFCTCRRQKCIDGESFKARLKPWYRSRTRIEHGEPR